MKKSPFLGATIAFVTAKRRGIDAERENENTHSTLHSSRYATSHQRKTRSPTKMAKSVISGTMMNISRNSFYCTNPKNRGRVWKRWSVCRAQIQNSTRHCRIKMTSKNLPYFLPISPSIYWVRENKIRSAYIPRAREIWCQNCCVETTTCICCGTRFRRISQTSGEIRVVVTFLF